MMKNNLLQILQTLQNIFKVLCNGSFIILIISFIVLSIIIYRFYLDIGFDIGLLSLIISFLISFVLTNFVLNKFEYSKNIYVGFIQKFLIFIIISITGAILLLYILKFFHLISSIYCSSGEAGLPNISGNETSGGDASGSVGNNGVAAQDVVKITSDSNNSDKEEFYNFKLSKRLVDNSFKNMADASTMVLDKIAPNLGVGAAAGSATSAAVKFTSGMAP